MDLIHIPAFIVALGVLIAVHEWGHFWVARRCGVKVLRFSIGFGTPILKWRDKQDTEFVISILPLGGYVRMVDEREGPVEPALLPYAFNRKTPLQRIAIVAAGPLVNLAFAVVVWWGLFIAGVNVSAPVIGKVFPNSLAEQAGLKAGDEVVAVDGDLTTSWDQVEMRLVTRIGDDGTVRFTVKPKDAASSIDRDMAVNDFMVGQENDGALKAIGVETFFPFVAPVVGEAAEGSAGALAGIKPGDRILEADGKPIAEWKDLVGVIRNSPDKAVNLKIQRDANVIELSVTPKGTKEKGLLVGKIGVAPEPVKFPEEMRRTLKYGPLDAIPAAAHKCWNLIYLTASSLWKLVIGKISLDNLSGPITIAKVAGDTASYGFQPFLMFLAYLSISLGVLNLLPVPVLDGGHLMFYFIEMIKGSPVSEKAQQMGMKIGLSLLVAFMGIAFYNDIMRF
ncbi:MAG TPA: sigma E protease regulator RseP [Pseudomonadales bacterium]|nr:sigma E protease regulator RseP [Pseudomonadales bacterium]